MGIPSGKRLHSYAKSVLLKAKSTISMASFNSYVKLPEGVYIIYIHVCVCCMIYCYFSIVVYENGFSGY